jgi:hypothetical protein
VFATASFDYQSGTARLTAAPSEKWDQDARGIGPALHFYSRKKPRRARLGEEQWRGGGFESPHLGWSCAASRSGLGHPNVTAGRLSRCSSLTGCWSATLDSTFAKLPLNLHAVGLDWRASATASVLWQGNWKWLAGAAPFPEIGRPPPSKGLNENKARTGWHVRASSPERPFQLGDYVYPKLESADSAWRCNSTPRSFSVALPNAWPGSCDVLPEADRWWPRWLRRQVQP